MPTRRLASAPAKRSRAPFAGTAPRMSKERDKAASKGARKAKKGDGWKSNLLTIGGALLLALFIRVTLFEAFAIDGPSMAKASNKVTRMNSASNNAPPMVSRFDFQPSPFFALRAPFEAALSCCLLIRAELPASGGGGHFAGADASLRVGMRQAIP